MKAHSLSLILVTVLSLTARGDLTIVQKVEGAGSLSEMTIKIKGDKERMDASANVSMIVDGKTGDVLNLMNDQKKFIRMSGDKVKAFAEMASKYSTNGGAVAEKAKPVRTGKKEMINGYETEEYVSETPLKTSYWIALNYPDSAAIMKQLQAITPSAWSDARKGMPNYRDFPGLPLRTQMTAGGKDITSTIVSVKQDVLSEAEFAVPKDFQEMKIPNMQNMLGDKPSVAPSAKP